MSEEPEYCSCGRPVEVVIGSGDRRLALCDFCWKKRTKKLLADLQKKSSRRH